MIKPFVIPRRPTVVGVTLGEDELRDFIAGPYVSILRVVTLATDSRAAAEDAIQEALARAWERGDVERLDRWILTVALNLTRSRWRRHRRELALAKGEPAVEADASNVDLHRALRSLPRRQREVVVLHYLMDLPVAEVAEVVDRSEGAVKNALFNARRSLAAVLTVRDTDEVPS